MERCVPRDRAFHNRTGALQLANTLRIAHEGPDRESKTGENLVGRNPGDNSRGAAAQPHDPGPLQGQKRFPHRRTADPEGLHQLALRWERVTGLIGSAQDHRVELAPDLLVDFRRADSG